MEDNRIITGYIRTKDNRLYALASNSQDTITIDWNGDRHEVDKKNIYMKVDGLSVEKLMDGFYVDNEDWDGPGINRVYDNLEDAKQCAQEWNSYFQRKFDGDFRVCIKGVIKTDRGFMFASVLYPDGRFGLINYE